MRSFGAGLIGAGIMAEVAHFTMAPVGFNVYYFGGIALMGLGLISKAFAGNKK